jgi:GT2 family glycosyltransferase
MLISNNNNKSFAVGKMTLKSPKVSIIVLNWNGRDDTLECLDSVSQIDYANFDVVVVDNGSRDDSVRAIREAFPEVAVLETGENTGFARGNNVGVRHALKQRADYLFLLNNDTIVDPQILNRFMDTLSLISREAILGAKIYYYSEPNRIWYAGVRWVGEFQYFYHLGENCIDDGKEFNSVIETAYACGCALFVSAAVLEKIGLLDEQFFLTFEETDLCSRARRAGIRSYVVPEAKVWHKVSRSFGGKSSPMFIYFLMRNRLLWARKNLSLPRRLVLYGRVSFELLRYYLPPRFHLNNSGGETLPAAVYRSFIEYIREFRSVFADKFNNPARKARLWAVRDYLLHRFGNCPDDVKALGNRLGKEEREEKGAVAEDTATGRHKRVGGS